MVEYPEHEKLRSLRGANQIVGDFIEWLAEVGFVIAQYARHDRLMPARANRDDLLADHFDIDQNRLEAEKRAMLDRLRQPTPDSGKAGGAPA